MYSINSNSNRSRSKGRNVLKRKIWALIVMFAMVFSLLPAVPALADTDPIDYSDLYRWTGLGITGTRSDTMQFKMTDGYIAFCVDENTVIQSFIDYVKVPLDHTESSNMFDNENADPDKIRAILTYAWDKNDPDEITAIQYALWNEMHGTSLPGSVNNNIKGIFNKLVDDNQTPPISAAGINQNSFTLTPPSPDSQQYIFDPSTTEYSFDFQAFSGANIVYSVFDENDDAMAAGDYEITDNGSGSYTLKLKNVSGPSGYRVEATTLKDTAVNAFVFMSLAGNSNNINIKKSQTVAGIKLSDTTQTKSFEVDLHYAATGSLDLSGTKSLTGRNLTAGEFTFELYEGENTSGEPFRSASNEADGSFSFETINYTQNDTGTKTYTVVEQTGELGGVSYDDSVFTMIVNIEDNGDGTLDVYFDEESDDPDDINFNNTYSSTGSLGLSGNKILTGRFMDEGEFTFELFEGDDTSGEPFRSASNEADGSFSFETINYTQNDTGTKTYTVVEQTGELGGVSYDTNTYTVTVNVTDNGDGTMTAIPSISGENDGIVFTNSYAATGSISFSGIKELIGRDLFENEFTFELYEQRENEDEYYYDQISPADTETAEPIRSASNDEEGYFSFESISFTLADVGTRTYTIVEQTGELGGVEYDDRVYTFIVHIYDNGDGSLSIYFDEESDDPEEITFTNTYSATGSLGLSGSKTLTGRELAAGEFIFEFYEGDDTSGDPFGTATNDADGSFSFETINYTLEDVGTKTYTVVEQSGDLTGIVYDTNTYTIIVSISDNGDGTLAVETTDDSDDPDEINFFNSIVTIVVEEEDPPLAEPTPTPAPLPTIKPVITIPLAPADPTLPTIEVVQEQLPQSGEKAPVWPIGLALVIISGGMAYLLNRKRRSEID